MACRLTIIELVFVVEISKLFKVDLVPQYGANPSKSFDKLIAFAGPIRHKFQVGPEILVFLRQPFEERTLVDNLHFLTCLLVHELIPIGLLALQGMDHPFSPVSGFENRASDVKILIDNQDFCGAQLERLQCIIHTVTDFAAILADLLEVFTNELFFLDEFDIAESLGGKLDRLVETIFAAIGYVDYFDNLRLKTIVKHIRLVQVVLEVGGTCKNEARNIDLVVADEVLNRQLGYLAHIVVALFFSQPSESQGRLSTATVLFGKIDRELVDDVSCITAECSKESAVPVHDDEAEFLIGFKQFAQRLGMELIVAQVKGGVDGLERLEIDVDLAFLALGSDNFTAVDNEAVGGTLVYNLSRCCVDVMADRTDKRLTRDLILDAVPNSSANIFAARETWSLGAEIFFRVWGMRGEKIGPYE